MLSLKQEEKSQVTHYTSKKKLFAAGVNRNSLKEIKC